MSSQMRLFDDEPKHDLRREDGSVMGAPDPSGLRRMRFVLNELMNGLSSVVPLHEQRRLIFEVTGKPRLGLMNEQDCAKAFGVLRRFEEGPREPDGGLLASRMDAMGFHRIADQIDLSMVGL